MKTAQSVKGYIPDCLADIKSYKNQKSVHNKRVIYDTLNYIAVKKHPESPCSPTAGTVKSGGGP